jgi:hypothetical protein
MRCPCAAPEKLSDTSVNVEVHSLIRLRQRAIGEIVLPINQLLVELDAHLLPRRTEAGAQQIVHTLAAAREREALTSYASRPAASIPAKLSARQVARRFGMAESTVRAIDLRRLSSRHPQATIPALSSSAHSAPSVTPLSRSAASPGRAESPSMRIV